MVLAFMYTESKRDGLVVVPAKNKHIIKSDKAIINYTLHVCFDFSSSRMSRT